MADDAPKTMTRDEVLTLKVGEIVIVQVDCAGDDGDDVERTHPAGTEARVLGIRTLPAPQGLAVTIEVGEAESERIVSVFDESDECGYAFLRPVDDDFVAEARMESAGAELMALTFRLEKHPEFAGDIARLREISGWLSIGRIDDMHFSFVKVIGAMVGAMRRRNFAFAEDRSISGQFAEFLDTIPDPLPGEIGHVDQATVDPKDRRDVFDAEIEVGEVRRWTDRKGVEYALSRDVVVKPNGVHGTLDVYAEGDEAALLSDGATVRLRSTGGALKIVGEGDMRRAARETPPEDISRSAATLLRPVPFDKETSAIVAKGVDLFLAHDGLPQRYETSAVERATSIRDALDLVAR